MIRKAAIVCLALLLAACAQKRVAPPATTVPIAPPPPRGEPDRFSNISSAQLKTLMGNPAFVRKDGATEMWRYDNKDCHAFFFLYGAGVAQAVRHVETVPLGKSAAADPACLDALRKK